MSHATNISLKVEPCLKSHYRFTILSISKDSAFHHCDAWRTDILVTQKCMMNRISLRESTSCSKYKLATQMAWRAGSHAIHIILQKMHWLLTKDPVKWHDHHIHFLWSRCMSISDYRQCFLLFLILVSTTIGMQSAKLKFFSKVTTLLYRANFKNR